MKIMGKTIGIIVLAVLLGGGCRDVFEKDISEKEVELLVPADSVETLHRALTFVWSERDGATGYRLVIVTPSFERPELYVLDTLVDGYSHVFTLEPGVYEWAVRPENSAYEGIYKHRRFTVLPETDDGGEEQS